MIKVIDFINNFKKQYSDELVKVFTESNSYHFAVILHNQYPNSEILYDPAEHHFITSINNQLYDIRGYVSDKYNKNELYYWEGYELFNSSEYKRIVKYCINLEDYTDYDTIKNHV